MNNDNNKCVYLHLDREHIVRYVGSGGLERAYKGHANSSRGKQYADFVEQNGKLDVKIVAEGLTKLEAEDLEREMFDIYQCSILNVNRPRSVKAMTKQMFEDYVYYDETSSSCLRWKVDGTGSGGHMIKSHCEAGSLNKSGGYYQIAIRGTLYLVHRIVAVLHDLNVNGLVVDHIDRNKINNKIFNLRVVSQKENMQNKSMHSNNTSGVQGVLYDKRHDQWISSWMQNGKQKYKRFMVKNYTSSEHAFNAAVEYRQQMVDLHY